MSTTVVAIGDAFEEPEFALLSERFQNVLVFQSASDAFGAVSAEQPQLVIVGSDVHVDAALGLLLSLAPSPHRCPVVALTRGADEQRTGRLKSAGAMDCLPSPLTDDSIKRVLALLKAAEEQGNATQRFFCPHCPRGVPIVGQSPAILKTLQTLKIVAESLCNPVLLLGETGTGKELAAQAVHAWRCGDPDKFIAVNCATLNANLLESELFGHVKGAFTGADREKPGLMEVADSGTVLLDEISEMPLELQAKLLRVLQERKFRKVGGTADIRSRATIVASSNLSLYEEAQAGRFRKDLYYRLAVFPIEMPPLRDPNRQEDIPLLADYFIQTSKVPRAGGIRGLTAGARQRLVAHTWPGNVRELQNVIERALILERSDHITLESVIIEGRAPPADVPAPAGQAGEFSLETAEREFIHRALQVAGWHRTRAADMLGITRATLHAKIKRYDIQMPSAQPERGLPGNPPADGGPGAEGSRDASPASSPNKLAHGG